MPDPNPAGSPFQTVTTKKSGKISKSTIIITICIVAFLILGVFAGVLLVRQQQNISEKAQEALCPSAQACPVPGQPDLLRNCSSVNEGESPQEISCSIQDNVKQIAECGGVRFCCPTLGGSWDSTDLTPCMTPTPTPISTPTPTPIATATPTPDPLASVTPTPIATATPNSCGGTCGSNFNCGSGLYCYTSLGICRNPSCPTENDCICPGTSTSTPTPQALATPREIPVTGTDWPSIFGAGIGVFAIIGAILLAI